MEENNKIKAGDRVTIHFTGSHSLFDVEILCLPCDVGDCWKLLGKDGKLYNVQMFEQMEKL